MDKRENLLRALRRDKPEYVPFFFTLCNSLHEKFKQKTGLADYFEFFDMPIRYVELHPTKKFNDYSHYYDKLPEDAVIDEWGVGHVPGSCEHFSKMLHPMESFTTPDQIWEFPFPDILDEYRWTGFKEKVQKIKRAGCAAVFFALQIFEPSWYLRGMDNLLMDMLDNEDMAKAILDRMTGIQSAVAEKLAACEIDIIVYGDDVGTQKGMMMNPDLWRKWLKPTMQMAIKSAKEAKPDILAFYHSDGVIYDIIPDLIEIGVDVLNPVQPECMDPVKVKELYGNKLSFWGTIGTQTTMPFGNPSEIKATVKKMIETVGKGGGLVIAPTHILEPEVPWENIEALVSAVREYGKY